MKNLDLLQNLEFAIIEVYRADPSLLDADAKDAVDALVRRYHSEEEGRTPPIMRLGERAQRVFDMVAGICEWRLGRASLSNDLAAEAGDAPEEPAPVPVSELVSALRKIQKSIPRWTRQGGRKGYLDFVSQYLP